MALQVARVTDGVIEDSISRFAPLLPLFEVFEREVSDDCTLPQRIATKTGSLDKVAKLSLTDYFTATQYVASNVYT